MCTLLITLCLLQILPGLQMTSLNSVLAQGMNLKKKHEVGYCLMHLYSL